MSHLEISHYFSKMIESVEKSKNLRKASKKRFQPVDMKIIDQAVEQNDFEFVKRVGLEFTWGNASGRDSKITINDHLWYEKDPKKAKKRRNILGTIDLKIHATFPDTTAVKNKLKSVKISAEQCSNTFVYVSVRK